MTKLETLCKEYLQVKKEYDLISKHYEALKNDLKSYLKTHGNDFKDLKDHECIGLVIKEYHAWVEYRPYERFMQELFRKNEPKMYELYKGQDEREFLHVE